MNMEELMFKRMISIGVAALALVATEAAAESGVNVGTLSCRIEGGMGFVFGSSKDMSCVLTRSDGSAERYYGEINKYGVDIGFTNEAHMIWAVFAPGNIDKGAMAGSYGGATASVTAGLGLGANVLIGGSNDQIALQPVSIEGNEGLNIAAGVATVTLRSSK